MHCSYEIVIIETLSAESSALLIKTLLLSVQIFSELTDHSKLSAINCVDNSAMYSLDAFTAQV